ncbi:hypothetical protein BC939DRAFT_450609 [Gamsiella multidivaricata]|uniref:uncharacterized protein n=1 Tax=Gamsiella multidivaricata TaxID=101098 RepID=UPI00221FD96C|nr:uncharacterized protein BC939DRAFT_450609 [Gamsiella multidivaricata]KAI7824112.1 hypothetical protein BC939DRAFT_450609 [Gamsiella multidivaricata]
MVSFQCLGGLKRQGFKMRTFFVLEDVILGDMQRIVPLGCLLGVDSAVLDLLPRFPAFLFLVPYTAP